MTIKELHRQLTDLLEKGKAHPTAEVHLGFDVGDSCQPYVAGRRVENVVVSVQGGQKVLVLP